jgi:hypothetical protein
MVFSILQLDLDLGYSFYPRFLSVAILAFLAIAF